MLLPAMASSISVGALGTGGGVATGIPKGFLEPVWCVLTGCASGGDANFNCGDEPKEVRGVEAGRAGKSAAVFTAGF